MNAFTGLAEQVARLPLQAAQAAGRLAANALHAFCGRLAQILDAAIGKSPLRPSPEVVAAAKKRQRAMRAHVPSPLHALAEGFWQTWKRGEVPALPAEGGQAFAAAAAGDATMEAAAGELRLACVKLGPCRPRPLLPTRLALHTLPSPPSGCALLPSLRPSLPSLPSVPVYTYFPPLPPSPVARLLSVALLSPCLLFSESDHLL